MAAVRRYDILDTPPDGSFDQITALAAELCSTPISIISVVDEDRIWFKSHHGLDVPQIGRDLGLCASAILQDVPYLVSDALADPRTLSNPLVAGEFGLRFYLAVPLRTGDGHNLGTLCVIDKEPRPVSQEQIGQLQKLGSLVMDQLELRLSANTAIAEQNQARRRAEMLVKEIDHRVMNSLQFVASLLDMQSRGAINPEAAVQLEHAAGRVAAVARVHRHFYMDEAVESTCGLEYLRRLCADLATSLGGVELRVRGAPATILTTRVMPLGLVVNELVTNAAKYGAQSIWVELLPVPGGGFVCRVEDNGPGLPAGFDPRVGKGLGMRVILALVQQLGGRLTYGAAQPHGAWFSLGTS